MKELDYKMSLIQQLLDQKGFQALWLQRVSSFAWATCGAASYINTAATDGAASLLITPSARYVVTNNIEAPRLEQEESLVKQGWEIIAPAWFDQVNSITEIAGGLRLAADGPYPGAADLSAEISRLRAALTPEEGERFRRLGRLCAAALDEAIRSVQPGQSEYEIASLLSAAAEKRGVQAIVNLVATDERVYAYRHPLPTSRKMDRYAMLVLCGRKWGLVCSLTRLVHIGPLPPELRQKMQAVAYVDARMIQGTRPGVSLAEIFESAIRAYAQVGYAGEWKLHHQGGLAGYEPREVVATPATLDQVQPGQVYAWNPSITGVKSEDTILVGEKGNEILTAIPGWPEQVIDLDGQLVSRPAVLEIR